MEPVGLAVGLVGLFSTCMDVMQRVDSYGTAGRDSRQLDAQLNATMHLFERWGDGVGISKGKLSGNHHPELDNPQTFAVVQGLLNSIKDFSATSNEPPSPKGLQKTPSFPISGDVSSHGSKISRWQKTAWALRGKLKQTSHVQALAGLVSDLYGVVPPDTAGSKALTRTPSFKDLSISAGEQPYAVEIRELLKKIEEEMVGNDSNDKRVEETCEWILHRNEFQEWQQPSSSSKLLWIKGPAGFGKTVLCARIVQELERIVQDPVAYFFLSSRYDGRDDPFSAIRAWLTMMMQRSPGARDIVTKTRQTQHEPLASQATILQTFREVMVGIPGCILVLDGLDECTGMTNTDTKSVLYFLQELRIAITNTTAKILISSRGDPIIQQGISDFHGYSEYTIVPDDVGPDLMAYSSKLVRAKLPNKDEPTRKSIARKMTNRSKGQFQWVKLQEGSLRRGRSRKQLEREIDETPSGLDSLYDREWNRINSMADSDKDRALSLLRWTAFALRPLTVYEITEAVLITEDMEELPFEEMPDCVDQDYVESMILELCGSLIQVRHVSSSENIENPERIQDLEEDSIGLQEVYLSHFSVKEHLLLKTFPGTNALFSNEKLRVTNKDLHNSTLAKHCLRFINLGGAFESVKMNSNARSEKHFVFYAMHYGFHHCRDVKTIDPELQQAGIALLNSRNQNWPFVKEFMKTEMMGNDPDFQDSSISPFVLAVFGGLTDAMAHLIQEGSLDMNDRSFGNSTPLFLACASNRKDIVELLIDNGADINARCYEGQTALHISADNGDDGAIGLLLSKGADVSVVDDDGRTALGVALAAGNAEAARLLLDGGADIPNGTADGFTPLSMASCCGNVDLVKILIERGADVNQVVLNGQSSLLHAVQNDHPEIVELLIDNGAKLTSVRVDGRIFSLLDVAAGHGHVNTFKALVDKGAAPTSPQPLFLATSYGYYHGFIQGFYSEWYLTSSYFPYSSYHKILELLLQSGAQVNTCDEDGDSPLYVASFIGLADIVEILIKNGADLDIKSASGETPLHCCSRMGHFAVTQLLLQNGADIASKDNFGRTPLHNACKSGNMDIVRLITSTMGPIDEPDLWGSTPLSIAARFGRVEIVRWLIDACAVDVKSRDKFGRTATWWASSLSHDAVEWVDSRFSHIATNMRSKGHLMNPTNSFMAAAFMTIIAPLPSQNHRLAYNQAIKMKLSTATALYCREVPNIDRRTIVSSLLATLLAGSMVSAKYTTEIPDDAVWVTNWDELQAAPRFGGVLLPKYGGFVIEVDEKIVLATDEQTSKEVLNLLTDLEENDPQPEDEQTAPNKRDLDLSSSKFYPHSKTLQTMSQPNTNIHEPTDPEATCCNSEDGFPYKDLSPEQKEISDILRNMDRDPDLLGLADLGKDGVFRFLDADRNIQYAVPLRPALIKALIDRLPYDPEVEKFWRGVDGTKVPEEQWYNPPEGILPSPLTEEEKKEEREIMEKNKDKIDKIREDLKNGIHRERLVFIESDNKLE
ncbi:Ankyrin repeat domain containing protein 50 [Fusarium agapanthi]|uniref:Ankyrin repeat domain containing protein 50 n=1 Tax=Fusarium agapanthi TaxID=1803897 RepID=A0A9P5BN87_9HYPO|nr:Ankyrin repeat domain containing protein 50 [Fusarium agapanthi]